MPRFQYPTHTFGLPDGSGPVSWLPTELPQAFQLAPPPRDHGWIAEVAFASLVVGGTIAPMVYGPVQWQYPTHTIGVAEGPVDTSWMAPIDSYQPSGEPTRDHGGVIALEVPDAVADDLDWMQSLDPGPRVELPLFDPGGVVGMPDAFDAAWMGTIGPMVSGPVQWQYPSYTLGIPEADAVADDTAWMHTLESGPLRAPYFYDPGGVTGDPSSFDAGWMVGSAEIGVEIVTQYPAYSIGLPEEDDALAWMVPEWPNPQAVYFYDPGGVQPTDAPSDELAWMPWTYETQQVVGRYVYDPGGVVQVEFEPAPVDDLAWMGAEWPQPRAPYFYDPGGVVAIDAPTDALAWMMSEWPVPAARYFYDPGNLFVYESAAAIPSVQAGAFDVQKVGIYVAGGVRHGVYVAGAVRHGIDT